MLYLAATTGGPASAATAGTPLLTITVSNTTDARGNPTLPVSLGLIGGNLRWLGDADNVLNPDGTLNASITARSAELGLGSVRYPGGTVANLFDWTKMQGPTPTGCQTNAGFIGRPFGTIPPADSDFTIARQAQFVSTIWDLNPAAPASQPLTNLMIPMINETPSDAVGFVESMAQQTGQRNFTVEIGNEPTLPNQHYWRAWDETRRLAQYVNGATSFSQVAANQQDAADTGWNNVYAAGPAYSGDLLCDLSTPIANADGSANQEFRPRYVPIAVAPAPVLHIGTTDWQYVPDLADFDGSANVFTMNATHTAFVFGDGIHGGEPDGPISIASYAVADQPGFNDFYAALKAIEHSQYVDHVNVCSSWTQPRPFGPSPDLESFVNYMQQHAAPYDCLAAHVYTGRSSATSAELYNTQLQQDATRLITQLQSLLTDMRAGNHPDRFLTVTEYGLLQYPPTLGHSFAETLFRDRLLTGQARLGVQFANLSNFGDLFAADPNNPGTYYLSTNGRMLSLWRRLVGGQPKQVQYCDPVRSCAPRGIYLLATRNGNSWNTMILNSGASAWTPNWRIVGHTGDSCLVIRRMRTSAGLSLGSTDLPVAYSGDGTLRSMRPVFIKKWSDTGSHELPNAGSDGSRTIFPYSIELMTIQPVTSATSDCTIAPPFSMTGG